MCEFLLYVSRSDLGNIFSAQMKNAILIKRRPHKKSVLNQKKSHAFLSIGP